MVNEVLTNFTYTHASAAHW